MGDTPDFVTAGDFDGDGHLDLVTANAFVVTVSILLGQGDGTFSSPGPLQWVMQTCLRHRS